MLVIRPMLTLSGCHSTRMHTFCSVVKNYKLIRKTVFFTNTNIVTFKIRTSREHNKLHQLVDIYFLWQNVLFLSAKGEIGSLLFMACGIFRCYESVELVMLVWNVKSWRVFSNQFKNWKKNQETSYFENKLITFSLLFIIQKES